MTDWCKAHYLDASVLVKLVADDPSEEPGRDVFHDYYWKHTASIYATSFCFTEALSAFKSKFVRKKITESEYIANVQGFILKTVGANLGLEEPLILYPEAMREAERLVRTHHIDFLDCFQIVTILHRRFSVLGSNSQSLLITADDGLAKAALLESANVWNCRAQPSP